MNIDWSAIVATLEQWANVVRDFFNQPVPIIGCTIGFLLITILSILSKTSWGKKAINKAMTSINSLKDETTLKLSETSKMIEDIKSEYNEKLALSESKSQEIENLLLTISEQLHNKKIKECVEEYRKTKSETKLQVNNLVEQSSKAIDLKMSEFQEQINVYKKELEKQYQEMVANYQKELEELQEKLNEKKELTYVEEEHQANE